MAESTEKSQFSQEKIEADVEFIQTAAANSPLSTAEPFSKGDHENVAETDPPISAIQYPSGLRLLLLTIGLMAMVLTVALDNYIISTAIPRLTSDFKSLNLVGWYGSSYFLTLMAFQPAYGQLFTLFPIKQMFLTSVVVFEVGSLVSASAPTAVAFIIGRLVCGAAAGGIWCGTLSLIAYAVPPTKRFLYVSVVTSIYGVASAAGPLLGGVFTDSRLTWRFCFWLNLPIGFVAFLLIMIFLKPPPLTALGKTLTFKQKVARIDFGGTCLLIMAFTCFFLALQWGGTIYSWPNPKVWGCLLGFTLLIAVFALLQMYLEDRATIPFHILGNRTASFGLIFTVFISMTIGVLVYYLPFYFQSILGHSATSSGILTLPYIMALLITPMIAGAMITIVGYYIPFLYVGSAIATAGAALLFTLDQTSRPGQYIGYQFLAAFGAGLCRQIPFTAVPMSVPPTELATASALVAFCNSLGPVLAITIGQAIFTNEFAQQLAQIPGVDVNAIVTSSNILNLEKIVPPQLFHGVIDAMSLALTRTLSLAIPSAAAAFLCCFGLKWVKGKGKTK